MATTVDEINSKIIRLSPEDQRRVLDFVQELQEVAEDRQRLLSLPKSPLPEAKIPASALLGFKIPTERLDEIEQAIKDCERIDIDEW